MSAPSSAPHPIAAALAGRQLVLASASPRRAELLARLGLTFTVDPADVDETAATDESAGALVARLSALKASTVASRHDGAVIVAADTVVVVDGEILGKPADTADAAMMLGRLSGRNHQVITGMTVAADADLETVTTDTEVTFRSLSAAEIDWYVATGEPFDKAGAYALQGIAACFVTAIDGSPDSVIGLSLAAFVDVVGRVVA